MNSNTSPMKILVTGATGMIGNHLVPLLASDNDVTALTRNVAVAERILGSRVTLLSDISHLQSLDGFDLVINLAGEPLADKRWNDEQKQRICDSRWQLTETLTNLISQSAQPPSIFISGSAIGYYGRQGDDKIDESFTAVHDEFTHQVCKKWEQLALSAQSELTRVCVLRTGIVLGKQAGALEKMLPPFRMGLGGPVGSGKQYMSWIHIDDMIRGIVHLVEHSDLQGVYNLTAPTPVTNKEFSQQLGRCLHRPTMMTVPAAMLKLMMGEMADLVIHGQRVIPARLVQSGFDFKYPELSEALESLDL